VCLTLGCIIMAGGLYFSAALGWDLFIEGMSRVFPEHTQPFYSVRWDWLSFFPSPLLSSLCCHSTTATSITITSTTIIITNISTIMMIIVAIIMALHPSLLFFQVLLFLAGHFPARIITPLLTSFLHLNVAPEADFYLFGVFAIVCALWLVWVRFCHILNSLVAAPATTSHLLTSSGSMRAPKHP
jgi:hypothetical protein